MNRAAITQPKFDPCICIDSQGLRLRSKEVIRLELIGLIQETVYKVLAFDAWEASYIKNQLFWIHRRDLASRFSQSVNDNCRETTKPCIVGSIKTSRPRTNDGDII